MFRDFKIIITEALFRFVKNDLIILSVSVLLMLLTTAILVSIEIKNNKKLGVYDDVSLSAAQNNGDLSRPDNND